MHTPPNPGITAYILEVARRMGYVGAEIGTIEGYNLSVEDNGAGRVKWLATQALPARLAPRQLSREAYEALRYGELSESGTLIFKGAEYNLIDAWDGKQLVAELSKV